MNIKFEVWLNIDGTSMVLQADKLNDISIMMFERGGWKKHIELKGCNYWHEAYEMWRKIQNQD